MAAAQSHTPTTSNSTRLIPALLFLVAATSWFGLEYRALIGFDGGVVYDFSVESLSDLGVDYRQVHPLKHWAVTSYRASTQNYNFMLNGALFLIAQSSLLFGTQSVVERGSGTTRVLRGLFAALYAVGMVLMAQVHGGPREQHVGSIGWHWIGLTLVAIAGNGNSVLAGFGSSGASTIYRLVSVVAGIVGLHSFVQFQSLGQWNHVTKVGLWQRGTVYSVLAWQAATAIELAVGSGSRISKAKRV